MNETKIGWWLVDFYSRSMGSSLGVFLKLLLSVVADSCSNVTQNNPTGA